MLANMTAWITTSDGVRIAYHEMGASDPPIVFVHGISGNRRGFGFQEEYFSPNHRCVAVDLRGNGDSDKPNEVYSIAQYADDVAELIRQLGLWRSVLVGHSMGGQVVISVAARHPELVMAVASLDSPSNIPGWQNRFHAPFDHLMTFDGPYREAVHAFLKAAYLPTDDPSRVGGLADRLAGIPDHVIVRAWQAMSAYNPTSTPSPDEVSLSLYRLRPARSRPGSATRTMSEVGDRKTVGAGHQATKDVPDQINAMLNRFIQHAKGIAAEMIRTGGVLPIQLSLSLKDRPHMTEAFTTSDGVRIAYHQVGRATRPSSSSTAPTATEEASASKRSTSPPTTAAWRST